MVVYNTTNITEANNFIEIMKASNELVHGIFIGLFLLVLALVVFFALKHHNTKVAIIATSSFMSIVCILCWAIGLLGTSILIISIMVMLASLLMYIWNKP